MDSTAAKLVLLAFLAPTAAVFVIAYRHALRSWLARPSGQLPLAVVASRHGAFDRGDLGRRFHAVVIAIAFSSVFIMGLIAVALVLTAIVASAA